MEKLKNDNFFQELIGFARTHKKLWMIPLILFLLSLGAVLFVVEGSALSPFFYTLF